MPRGQAREKAGARRPGHDGTRGDGGDGSDTLLRPSVTIHPLTNDDGHG